MRANLWEPLEDPLGAVHVGGCPHQEADMEGGLPHRAPVLHVPAVLGVPCGDKNILTNQEKYLMLKIFDAIKLIKSR